MLLKTFTIDYIDRQGLGPRMVAFYREGSGILHSGIGPKR